MSRGLLITIHMYLSSFFAAAVLLVATSGGLYLLGIKGSVRETQVAALAASDYTLAPGASKAEVQALLAAAGVADFDFEYVRQNASGTSVVTRPTSRTHYRIEAVDGQIVVKRAEPDLQARLMELHMGHGPGYFKQFQKLFALGMLLIILSGLWMGLSSARLRRNTGIAVAAGLATFLALVLS